ncbi:ATP-binding protein [Lachnospira pectinoschiza]|uniref:Circadian input-output histidine kinase CikA n=1 Tax=Lachnospira pectinoschiza TaxID=28052 RepID=A0A1G9ZST3_9FIRM|nr:ATP-binding protein [Lachnospira pectinoschiza]SDN24682.1 Signal transduction histidine kinase [Lachnospira pectinoschiza]
MKGYKKALWILLLGEFVLLIIDFISYQMKDVIKYDMNTLPFSAVSNMVNFICDLLILLTFLISWGITVIRRFVDGRNTGLEYLTLFDLLATLYFFLESKYIGGYFYVETTYTTGLISILMTIPILLLLYYEKQYGNKYRRLYDVMLLLSFLIFFVQLGLFLSKAIDVKYIFLSTYSYIVIDLIVFFVCCTLENHRLKVWDLKLEEIGLFVSISCGIIDVCLGFGDIKNVKGTYFRYGITVYSIIMVIVLIVRLMETLLENSRVSSEMLAKQVEIMESQNNKLREAKKEADEAKQQAQVANKAKSNFLAHMSHEIRTPINAIIGMDTMILRDSKDPEILSYARDIEKASNNLYTIVNDILDFSKIESGKMEIVETSYNLKSMIHDCIGMIMMRAKSKRLSVVLKNDTKVPACLIGDAIRIRQIINNILTNAIKYTDYGSVTMFVGYSPTDEADIINLIVQVTDTGQGMKKEDLSNLFHTFQRINIERNYAVEGTGLGLSISKQLVDLMGGSIEVESEYGVGSTFTITIPQKLDGDELLGDISSLKNDEDYEENRHISFVVNDVKILVVDDIPANIKVVEGLLKNTNIGIDYCDNGNTAIAFTRNVNYDMIFLDHMMPGKDGVETFKEIKADKDNLNRETPIIMLTANAINGAKKEYLSIGFDDYLAKPIRELQLEAIIRKYLPPDSIVDEEVDKNWHENYRWYDKPTKDEDFNKIIEEGGLLDITKLDANNLDTKKTVENAVADAIDMADICYIDDKTGMEYCGGIRELYDELKADYVKENRFEDIKKFYEANDFNNYRIAVHGLKSTSLTIGAKNFSALCKEIEQGVKAGNIDIAHQKQAYLMESYEKLLKMLGWR